MTRPSTRALEDRTGCEITFPRLAAYRWEIPEDHLTANFNEGSRLALSSYDVPTRTYVAPIVGEASEHRLERFEAMRHQEVAFRLAKRLLDERFRTPATADQPAGERPHLFPRLVTITGAWLDECVTMKDDAFVGLLAIQQRADDAVDRIYRAILSSAGPEPRLVPILRPFDPIGSTRFVDFDTTKATYLTSDRHCRLFAIERGGGPRGGVLIIHR